MDEATRSLSEIRSLSEKRQQHEISQLTVMIESLSEERDAFETENQAIVELLMERGVHHLVTSSDGGADLKTAVERLVSERERQAVSIDQLEKKRDSLLQREKELETKYVDLKQEIDALTTKGLERNKQA